MVNGVIGLLSQIAVNHVVLENVSGQDRVIHRKQSMAVKSVMQMDVSKNWKGAIRILVHVCIYTRFKDYRVYFE